MDSEKIKRSLRIKRKKLFAQYVAEPKKKVLPGSEVQRYLHDYLREVNGGETLQSTEVPALRQSSGGEAESCPSSKICAA
jgi:hypothetical protein